MSWLPQSLKKLVSQHSLPRPKALLVISAHYVEKEHTVMTSAKPGLLYDYYGFPDVAYKVGTVIVQPYRCNVSSLMVGCLNATVL